MSVSPETPQQGTQDAPPVSRDAANWATPVSALKVGNLPQGAVNLNVEGRKVLSPIQGFGKMWQKTYKVSVGSVVSPEDVIAEWKQNFPMFWPANNFFYGPVTGIAPGEVAVLNLSMPGKLKLSTGVLVVYADDESFTLMAPEGHMFAGWITFSAYPDAQGNTVAQAQLLIRSNDPIYELGLTFGGHAKEDKFWFETLGNLAKHFGYDSEVEKQIVCVDKKRQWKRAKNVWKNSAVRSGIYMTGAPFRLVAKPFKRSSSNDRDPQQPV
ncbi:MAG: hypothetical protein M3N53_12135 [Actinomycetota bacterium]|nr:hypothetical protein [Actinomycetota bacterium]